MFWQKCGAELTTGAVFCIMCGNRVPSIADFELAKPKDDIIETKMASDNH